MLKCFRGFIEHTFFYTPAKASVVESNTLCVLSAKVCCETWSKVGGLYVIRVLWDWASTSRSAYHTLKNKKPLGIYDTLHSVSTKKSSTMARPLIPSTCFPSKLSRGNFCGMIFFPPKLHVHVLSRCKFGGMIILPAKIISNHFPSKTSRCYYWGKDTASLFWHWPWCMYEMRCTWFLPEKITGFQILQIGILIWWVFNSRILKKKIKPEYPKSETESKFCFHWGSQKLEPTIRICNLVVQFLPCPGPYLRQWVAHTRIGWHQLILIIGTPLLPWTSAPTGICPAQAHVIIKSGCHPLLSNLTCSTPFTFIVPREPSYILCSPLPHTQCFIRR